MSRLLLVIDVDGTLCGPIARGEGVTGFRRGVRMGFGEPFVEAQRALRERPACAVVVVSTRPECLRRPTTTWLRTHFNWLADAPLHLRSNDDDRSDEVIRALQITAVRGPHCVVLIDDARVSAHALLAGDIFIPARASDAWSRFALALPHPVSAR